MPAVDECRQEGSSHPPAPRELRPLALVTCTGGKTPFAALMDRLRPEIGASTGSAGQICHPAPIYCRRRQGLGSQAGSSSKDAHNTIMEPQMMQPAHCSGASQAVPAQSKGICFQGPNQQLNDRGANTLEAKQERCSPRVKVVLAGLGYYFAFSTPRSDFFGLLKQKSCGCSQSKAGEKATWVPRAAESPHHSSADSWDCAALTERESKVSLHG